MLNDATLNLTRRAELGDLSDLRVGDPPRRCCRRRWVVAEEVGRLLGPRCCAAPGTAAASRCCHTCSAPPRGSSVATIAALFGGFACLDDRVFVGSTPSAAVSPLGVDPQVGASHSASIATRSSTTGRSLALHDLRVHDGPMLLLADRVEPAKGRLAYAWHSRPSSSCRSSSSSSRLTSSMRRTWLYYNGSSRSNGVAARRRPARDRLAELSRWRRCSRPRRQPLETSARSRRGAGVWDTALAPLTPLHPGPRATRWHASST